MAQHDSPADGAGGEVAADVAEYRTRWIYFALFLWLQCSGRFMSLLYLSEGLTEDEIGAVFAVGSFTSPVASTCIGFLADHLTRSRGPVARVGCFAACISLATVVLALQGLPWPGISRFKVMFVCRIFMDMGRSVAIVLLDAITLQGLHDRQQYGQERNFGAISWALSGVGLGLLMDAFGPRVAYRCLPFGTLAVFFALWRAGKPPKPRLSSSDAASPPSVDGARGFVDLLKCYLSSFASVSFFVFAITLGMGMTLVENLLFLYFRDRGASYFVCGLSVVVTVVFEVPLFRNSKKLFELMGTRGLLTLAGFCYSFRVIGYTLCPGGAWVLFFEPMHGVTYAAWQTASVEMMASITPPELAASGQAFLSTVRSLLGTTTGNLVGGYVIKTFGEAALYRSAALLVLAGLGTFLLGSRPHRSPLAEQHCQTP